MSDTIKTLGQLVALLPDNTTRAIAPVDVRELAVSAWGALMDSDPTFNDDNANTAGNGFFAEGSRWTNRLNKTYWVCFGGTPFAAIWWQFVFWQDLPPFSSFDVVAGTNVVVVEAPAGTFTVSVPTFPAINISAGAIPAGVTLAAPQLSAGAIPAGVTLAAPQLSAGAIPAGVTIPYSQVTSPPPAGTTWTKYDIDFTDWTASPMVFFLRAMPAREVVEAVMVRITVAWSFTFGTTASVGAAWTGGDNPGSPTGNYGGTQAVMTGGIPTAVMAFAATLATGNMSNQSCTDGYTLNANLSGFGGAATAGHLELWVLTSSLPA